MGMVKIDMHSGFIALVQDSDLAPERMRNPAIPWSHLWLPPFAEHAQHSVTRHGASTLFAMPSSAVE